MTYEIKWRDKALKDLRKLPKTISERIVKRVDMCKDDPQHFLERLTDDPGYKLRVGGYRVIVDVIEKEKVLAVRLLGHRKDIYKKKK